MADSEYNLWNAFQEGDRKAFEELLHVYYRPLFDYGTKFVKDRDQLKDYVHDLFVNLWERRLFLGPVTNLKVYLFIALRNLINRRQKTASRWEELPDELSEYQPGEETHQENRIIAQETDLLNQTQLQRTINRLPKRQQEVIHLKFFSNLTNEQIAQVLAMSKPAVANLLSLALRSCREQWGLIVLVIYYL